MVQRGAGCDVVHRDQRCDVELLHDAGDHACAERHEVRGRGHQLGGFGDVGSGDADGQPAAGPVITTQPANASVTAPATATFSVVASGSPTPTYQWSSEAPGASSFTAISGATSASYTTPATTVAQSGTEVRGEVTNSSGSVTSVPATLTVNPAVMAPVDHDAADQADGDGSGDGDVLGHGRRYRSADVSVVQ